MTIDLNNANEITLARNLSESTLRESLLKNSLDHAIGVAARATGEYTLARVEMDAIYLSYINKEEECKELERQLEEVTKELDRQREEVTKNLCESNDEFKELKKNEKALRKTVKRLRYAAQEHREIVNALETELSMHRDANVALNEQVNTLEDEKQDAIDDRDYHFRALGELQEDYANLHEFSEANLSKYAKARNELNLKNADIAILESQRKELEKELESVKKELRIEEKESQFWRDKNAAERDVYFEKKDKYEQELKEAREVNENLSKFTLKHKREM